MAPPNTVLEVPQREIIAIEHPLIVKNIDNGIRTLGRNDPFKRIIECKDARDIIPLYLRYDDPLCTPLFSHNTATNNLLLKITVPKRTGRKRKRGSQDPFVGSELQEDEEYDLVQSQGRLDQPSSLLRKLRDTKDDYTVEVAGEIKQSHRFRGLSDFQHTLANTDFMPKFREVVNARSAEDLRKFKFNPSMGVKQMEEFIPAPSLTLQQLPFNWGWHQNANIYTAVDEVTGQKTLINRQGNTKVKLSYLGKDVERVPTKSPLPLPNDPELMTMINALRGALEERPLYTRRALINKVGLSKELWMFRFAIQYVGYQFKGGPFRDAVIKYGVDPRSDPKYRPYQTFFFKLFEEETKADGMQWKDVRTNYSVQKKGATKENRESHIFNGKTLILDGKIWQGCDLHDPILRKLIQDSPYREKCDTTSDGWFPEGSMAKIRAIMKTKLMAVCCKRDLTEEDFAEALAAPDFVPDKKSKSIHPPVPKVGLSIMEIEEMKKQGLTKAIQTSSLKKRLASKKKARIDRVRSRVEKEPRGEYKPRGSQKQENLRALLPKPETTQLLEAIRAQNAAQGMGPRLTPGPRGGLYQDIRDQSVTFAENEAAGNTGRSAEQSFIDDDEPEDTGDFDDEEDEDEDDRSEEPSERSESEGEDEGGDTDVEEDEMSDGAPDEMPNGGPERAESFDSEATDVVDFQAMYHPHRPTTTYDTQF